MEVWVDGWVSLGSADRFPSRSPAAAGGVDTPAEGRAAGAPAQVLRRVHSRPAVGALQAAPLPAARPRSAQKRTVRGTPWLHKLQVCHTTPGRRK